MFAESVVIAMARVVLLIVLVWILYQIVKRIWANAKSHDTEQKVQDTNKDAQQQSEQKMIQCAQCGCHVPETDSQMINEQIVCSNPECQHTQSKKAHSNQAKSDKPDHGDWFNCQYR